MKRNRSLVAGGSVSPNTLTYTGDGLLSRLDQYNGTVVKPVWDGQNMLLEQNGSNATQVVYSQRPQLYGSLVSQKRGTTKRYYHYNLIGTTDRLTDASQAVTDSYILEAFGATQTTSGSTVNPFKFIGELGYYNYQTSALTTATWVRARHYEPIYYRWLSEDPLGVLLSDDVLYKYCKNSPFTVVDPSGLCSRSACEHQCSIYAALCAAACVGSVALGCALKCGTVVLIPYPLCVASCIGFMGSWILECAGVCGLAASACFLSCQGCCEP